MYLDTPLICMRFFMRILRSFISFYSRCSFWAETPFSCRSISITCQIVSVVAYTQPRICVSANFMEGRMSILKAAREFPSCPQIESDVTFTSFQPKLAGLSEKRACALKSGRAARLVR